MRLAGSTSMRPPTLALVAGAAAFLVVAAGGIVGFGNFSTGIDPAAGGDVVGANSFAVVLAVALVVAFAVYAGVEYAQTGRIESISSQFDTRTVVLMPFAIALNIVLGQAVAGALKVPIYLDSIGTILVGALAGPIPGAVTGLLSNLLWTYVVPPPFHSDFAGAFAIVAAMIGVMAGLFGRAGWLRPRPDRSFAQLALGGGVAIVLILGLSYLAAVGYQTIIGAPALSPQADNQLFVVLGWIALILVGGTILGLLALLFIRRDLTAAYVVVAGIATGIVAALISAPISANVFSGVTGAGTDFLVAAFRQAGADVQAATLGQGLISDPIDKVTTYFVVYLILSAMARRIKARFPQGERLIEQPEIEGAAA